MRRRPPDGGRSLHGGVRGNALLTNLTASVLLVLLAAEGITVVSIEGLVRIHMFIGMILIPPVALKLATTGYRFVRYYTGSRPYREKGPPGLWARLTAPILVLATISLLATGVSLMVIGHGSDGLLAAHLTSFVVWVAMMAIHLLTHAPGLIRSVRADWRSMLLRSVAGSGMRGAILAAVLGGGLALALATLGLITGWHGE